jgi:hypothetical protein
MTSTNFKTRNITLNLLTHYQPRTTSNGHKNGIRKLNIGVDGCRGIREEWKVMKRSIIII